MMKKTLFLIVVAGLFMKLAFQDLKAAVAAPAQVTVDGATEKAVLLPSLQMAMFETTSAAGDAEPRIRSLGKLVSTGEEIAVPFDSGPCARSRLAQLQHHRQRMNFAVSDGSRDSAEVRSTPLFIRETALEITCARLDFSLSDGSGNALGLRE